MERTLFKDEPVETTYVDIKVAEIDHLIPDAVNIVIQPTSAFCENVAQLGVLEPILLIKRSRGNKYDLAAGRRRILAAKKAGLDTIPARVFPAGSTRRDVITLSENGQRASNLLNEYKALEGMIGDGDSEDDIIVKTGLSRKKIQDLLRFRNLIPELKAGFEDGRLKPGLVARVAKWKKSIQKRLVTPFHENGTLRIDDLKDVRRAVKHEAVSSLPDTLFKPDPDEWKDRAVNTLSTLKSQIEAHAPREFLEAVDSLIAQARGG